MGKIVIGFLGLCVVFCGCGAGPQSAYRSVPPATSYAWYVRAQLLSESGDIDAAVDAMHQALLADHGDPALMAHLAKLLCTHDQAVQSTSVLLELARAELTPSSPGWPTLIEAEALCAVANQDPNRAAAILAQALEAWPDQAAWLLLDAEVALVQGDPARALQRLSRVVALRPANLSYLQRLAALELAQGRPQAAVDLLTPAPPPDAPASVWITLAEAQQALHNEQAAFEALSACIDLHPAGRACQQTLTRLAVSLASPSNEATLPQIVQSLSNHPAILVDIWRSLRETQPESAQRLRELILLHQPHLSEHLDGGLT